MLSNIDNKSLKHCIITLFDGLYSQITDFNKILKVEQYNLSVYQSKNYLFDGMFPYVACFCMA